MRPAIIAIGTANPPYKQQQKIAAELVATALKLSPTEKRFLKSIYRSTRIESRYSVLSDICREPGHYEFFPNDINLSFPSTAQRMQLYKDNALNLAVKAIDDCLANIQKFDSQTITHLITVSCTGMYAPGIDIEIVEKLKLKAQVKRTTVNFMGCYGAFNALKLAEAICQADCKAKVLVVSVEICTIHFQKNTSIDNIFSNAIFADGAAAVLIESSVANKKQLRLEDFYCDLLPQHRQDMTWHIADSGFDIALSSYVPDAIEFGIKKFIDRLLNQSAITLSDIDFYAIHPGGYNILKACERALSISKEANRYAYQVLKEFGNMSSATILFVLKAIWNDLKHEDQNKTIMSCAFGPGLTLESMLLRVIY